ncbi:hypothetical protein [Chamaesiphon sp.]|uniref:hypothetical protein n=1 Tax=Chamaesiphon sp. TaxID=2814140 RepID=UPI003593CE89
MRSDYFALEFGYGGYGAILELLIKTDYFGKAIRSSRKSLLAKSAAFNSSTTHQLAQQLSLFN